MCSVFVTAAFSFSGTELVGLAAAESETPQKSLPGAVKQVFWRITLFYILSLTFVGLLIPYTDPRLIGSGFIDVQASPFVMVAEYAGIPGFADFINVVILFSVISIGLSGVYGGSRTLCALAEQGYAPKIFAYVDRAGRPLWATVAIIACSPLAYITLASTGETVFFWLLQLSGLAALFTWGSICYAHIRFRAAWKHHGHTLDELPFQSVFGVVGSWIGLILIILVLIAQVSPPQLHPREPVRCPANTQSPDLHRTQGLGRGQQRRALLLQPPRPLRRRRLLRRRLLLEALPVPRLASGLPQARPDRRRQRPPRARRGHGGQVPGVEEDRAQVEEVPAPYLLGSEKRMGGLW